MKQKPRQCYWPNSDTHLLY